MAKKDGENGDGQKSDLMKEMDGLMHTHIHETTTEERERMMKITRERQTETILLYTNERTMRG